MPGFLIVCLQTFDNKLFRSIHSSNEWFKSNLLQAVMVLIIKNLTRWQRLRCQRVSSINLKSRLLAYLLQFLHHGEDEDEAGKAEGNEHTPYHRQRHCLPQIRGDLHEEVADSCGTKPAAHHHTLIFLRSHLADKRDAHR